MADLGQRAVERVHTAPSEVEQIQRERAGGWIRRPLYARGADGTFGDLRWRVGIVEEVIKGSDGICRQVRIRYRNAGERAFRTTKRAVRRVALLHSEAELCLVDELNAVAKATNVDYTRAHPDSEDVTSQAVAPSLPSVDCSCCW